VRPGPDQRWAGCPADLWPGQGCRFSRRDPGYPAPPAQSRTCSPCGWLSQPPTTMPDKTPPWHAAVADLPGPSMLDASTRAPAVSGLFTRACPRPVGFIVSPRPGALGACRVLQRLSSGMPGLKDSGGPPHPSHEGCFVWPARTLKRSASAISLFRSGTRTSGNAISPTVYRILGVRLPHLVRGLPRSAMGPTLDTGGRLTLTRPGLSPGKRRRASLGAITSLLTGAAPLDERSNATTANGAVSGAAAS
jgi:hypothetical protein